MFGRTLRLNNPTKVHRGLPSLWRAPLLLCLVLIPLRLQARPDYDPILGKNVGSEIENQIELYEDFVEAKKINSMAQAKQDEIRKNFHSTRQREQQLSEKARLEFLTMRTPQQSTTEEEKQQLLEEQKMNEKTEHIREQYIQKRNELIHELTDLPKVPDAIRSGLK